MAKRELAETLSRSGQAPPNQIENPENCPQKDTALCFEFVPAKAQDRFLGEAKRLEDVKDHSCGRIDFESWPGHTIIKGVLLT